MSEQSQEEYIADGETAEERILERVYAQDPYTRAFIIEIDLDHYEDVFNEWDPAPFKRRDLDPDLRVYLDESSEDIPPRFPVTLQFTAPEKIHNAEKEMSVRLGLRNAFAFEKRLVQRKLRRLTLKMAVQTVVAVALLVLVHWLGMVLEDPTLWRSLLAEGLTIGAWVFGWDAIATFAFERIRLRGIMRRWERFCEARIVYKYHVKPR